VGELGLSIRQGLHTGECEVLGEDVGGVGVHIAQRIAGKAETNQILVSSTMKDLVSGSGIQFQDRGLHSLKGIPERWRVYEVN
jgi:class 3 adenylate cyclase